MKRIWVAFFFVMALADMAFAQPTIFLVRHAERADAGAPAEQRTGADPSLSAIGHERAAALAAVLRDAGITAIFVTELKRTFETAAPLAKMLGITPTVTPARDTGMLVERLKQQRGNALVVGHSNTVPEIAKALGVKTPIVIEDDEFDNLLVITPDEPARFIRLHFR